VIACALQVHRELGAGFLEKVYENALVMEFRYSGIPFTRQVRYNVYYREQRAGTFVADLVIENRLILELKATRDLPVVAEAQLVNYLKVSGLSIGLLLNFGNASLQIRRKINSQGQPPSRLINPRNLRPSA